MEPVAALNVGGGAALSRPRLTSAFRSLPPEVNTPTPTAAAASAHTGARTRIALRRGSRARTRAPGGSGSRLAIARTRSRSSALAGTSPERSSPTRVPKRSSIPSGPDIVPHFLLELLQRAVEPRRARRRADPEQAGGSLPVEVEEHAQRDHLALAGGKAVKRRLERRRVAVAEHLALDRSRVQQGVGPLTLSTPLFGAEVIEGGRARQREEPRLRRSSPRVEAPQAPERPLEGLGREVLGNRAVPGQVEQVAENAVEVLLADCGEVEIGPAAHRGAHASSTPPRPRASHRAPTCRAGRA